MTSYQILFHPGVHEQGKPREEDENSESTPSGLKKNVQTPKEDTQNKQHKGESSKK